MAGRGGRGGEGERGERREEGWGLGTYREEGREVMGREMGKWGR